MASGIYNAFKGDLMEKQVDLANAGDTIKVALLSGAHSFTATNTVWANVSDNEIINQTGSGYTADGATLADQAVTTAATTKFDGTDTAWTTASFTAAHAVLYDTTNTSSLICSIDFSGDKTVSAGTFTIQWHGDGIITLA